ncbi:MAG TPA: 2-isopropylmalate synthase, partial [Candidatus Limnocylindria bacterium]
MTTELDGLIYDWNRDGRAARADYRSVELDDETLRDGLQGPSIRNPPLDVKRRLLHLMDALGIDTADIGLPGASPQARAAIVALAKETTKLRKLRPNMAIRTHPDDVRAAVEASTEAGVPIESCAFIGSSPIRRFAEDWKLDTMLAAVETSVATLVKAGLPVMFVTEDTTRADPDTLVRLYDAAIGAGAARICVSDTCGHATPEGVRNLLTF